jgi:hypothetical protein
MRLHAAVARWCLGKQARGAEKELAAQAEGWMAGQGIQDPARMAALLVLS